MPDFIGSRRKRGPRRVVLALIVAALGVACSVPGPNADEKAPADKSQMPAGDAARGFAYASEVCSACHAIAGGDRRSPRPAAPSFQSLADRPDMSRIGLAVLMQNSHKEMPDLIVGSPEIADLWAYIATLERDN